MCFPLAFDEEEELPLADFIYDNYDCDGEAAAWVDAFVQYSEEHLDFVTDMIVAGLQQ
ncbi:MAG: hypothetical protein K5695_10435 [Oscillospiraceae bacterium]|nr:hypothetical protein [Oscillospiraceae bacterium]